MDVVVLVVAIVAFAASWLTWTAARLDRLTSRLDTSWAVLDAALARRAAAATELAAHARRRGLLPDEVARRMEAAAVAATAAERVTREIAENALSRAVRDVLGAPMAASRPKTEQLRTDLQDTAVRVGIARQVYNDAVRDALRLRRQWLPRLLRWGKQAPPPYFEIDDTNAPVVAAAQVRLP